MMVMDEALPPESRALIAHSPISTVVFDLTGRPVFANSAFAQLWGADEGRLARLRAEYCLFDDRQAAALGMLPFIQRAYAGQAATLPSVRYLPDETPSLQGLGSSVRNVRCSVYPGRDAEGVVRFVVMLHEDVSDFVEARRRIHDGTEAFRALVEHSPDVVARLDRDYRHVYVNPAIFEATGRPPEDFIGRDHEELGMPRALYEQWRTVYRHVFETGTEGRKEFDFPTPTGLRRFSARVVPEFDAQGRVATVLSVARDVTEAYRARHEIERLNVALSKRVADLEALNDELEAFAYSVAHDLKGPLRSIEGFASAIEEDYAGQLDDSGRAFLGRLRGNAERMYRLLDDLMTLATVTGGEPARQAVDLGAVAFEMLAELRRQDPSHRPVVHIGDDLWAQADPALARIVLWNLLDNAWKFTRPVNAACIEVEAHTVDGERVFCVRDNGVGFDLGEVDRLFRLFRTKDRLIHTDSAGIGLATVRRVVHRHGGRVWGKGSPGEGAALFFHFGHHGRQRVAED